MPELSVLIKQADAENPIQRGLIESSYPVYDKDLDELPASEHYVVYHNQPPEVNTDKPVSWWMCDLRYPRELPETDREYENIFLCSRELIPLYEDHYDTDVFYMPQPGLPDKYLQAETDYEVEEPVIFIGNMTSRYHTNRFDIIDRISQDYSVLHISGEGQTRDQARLYQQAEFSLSISQPIKGYTSNRLYNILASGGLCLSLYFDGIEDLFTHGEHLLWFETADEAVELIDEYKDDKSQCDKIRTQGKELYQEKHTAQHRLDNIADIIRGDDDQFQGYLWS